MNLKANKLLSIVTGGVILIMVIIGLKSCGKQGETAQKQQDFYTINNITPSELRELGIEGDTPQDTIKTLIGEMKKTRQEVSEVQRSNKELMTKNRELAVQANNVQAAVDDAVKQEKENLFSSVETMVSEKLDGLQKKLASTENNKQAGQTANKTDQVNTNSDVPVGLGLDGESLADSNKNNTASFEGELVWVNPADQKQNDKAGNNNAIGINNPVGDGSIGFPTVFNNTNADTNTNGLVNNTGKTEYQPKKYFTIAENATLVGSVSMTALLGRVPINGQINDPYPFKVIIGKDNLMANGIDLPEVEGAVASGYAVGDWTLSCVRGKIHSLTFNFVDGRIVTVSGAENGNSANNGSDNGIGWLSDDNGLPCIPGERKTNAPQYLGSSFLLGMAAAGAEGLAQGQVTSIQDGTQSAQIMTGNATKYAIGKGLAGGIGTTVDWFAQRYGQMFDAVYVPPDHAVALHISKELIIDYDKTKRKVKYRSTNIKRTLD